MLVHVVAIVYASAGGASGGSHLWEPSRVDSSGEFGWQGKPRLTLSFVLGLYLCLTLIALNCPSLEKHR